MKIWCSCLMLLVKMLGRVGLIFLIRISFLVVVVLWWLVSSVLIRNFLVGKGEGIGLVWLVLSVDSLIRWVIIYIRLVVDW